MGKESSEKLKECLHLAEALTGHNGKGGDVPVPPCSQNQSFVRLRHALDQPHKSRTIFQTQEDVERVGTVNAWERLGRPCLPGQSRGNTINVFAGPHDGVAGPPPKGP